MISALRLYRHARHTSQRSVRDDDMLRRDALGLDADMTLDFLYDDERAARSPARHFTLMLLSFTYRAAPWPGSRARAASLTFRRRHEEPADEQLKARR